MKKPVLFIAVLILLASCNAQQGNNELAKKMAAAQQQLQKEPDKQAVWQQLYLLLNDNYTAFTAAERTQWRALLQKYAQWPTATLYGNTEQGNKIVIKGHIRNAAGAPLANAQLHVFQTDSRGYYTPLDSTAKKMGEPDARLFGFIITDSTGYFEIQTVRPASYPLQYKGKTIPQHVHINVTAKSYAPKNMQMVFDDDIVMDAYWRKWAKDNDYPVLVLDHSVPVRAGLLEIVVK
jgi:protocatechuate 3,4-dioxygenase beta subunit